MCFQVFQEYELLVNSIFWLLYEFGLGLVCGLLDGIILVFILKFDGLWEKVKIQQVYFVGVIFVLWVFVSFLEIFIGVDLRFFQRFVFGGCDNIVKVWKFENNSWKLDCFFFLLKYVDWVCDVGWVLNFGFGRFIIVSVFQDGIVVIWIQVFVFFFIVI